MKVRKGSSTKCTSRIFKVVMLTRHNNLTITISITICMCTYMYCTILIASYNRYANSCAIVMLNMDLCAAIVESGQDP